MGINWKLMDAKLQWADEGRLLVELPEDQAAEIATTKPRVPPGQTLTKGFPVLSIGDNPLVRPRDWQLILGGMVNKRIHWDWHDFQARPQVEWRNDIHCVTGWSRLDNVWQGISTREIVKAVQPLHTAKFVTLRSYDGYATALSMKDFLHEDAFLATHWEGAPLTREHGGPVRLVVPHLYFWKSAKWLRQIWFTDKEHRGTWEARGYHKRGDPWKQERYETDESGVSDPQIYKFTGLGD
ncbi:MAG: sulfite oxidase-like oxidoreductase [Alphaproteobacteria bacterium]|nr:sulfite oxidase-like oxidoreductase [Alphaproteobacteria bacterium SS10]